MTFYTFKFYVCGWVLCLNVFLCTMYVPGAYGGHKRTLGPPELELQLLAVIWVLGIPGLWKRSKFSNAEPSLQPFYDLF